LEDTVVLEHGLSLFTVQSQSYVAWTQFSWVVWHTDNSAYYK